MFDSATGLTECAYTSTRAYNECGSCVRPKQQHEEDQSLAAKEAKIRSAFKVAGGPVSASRARKASSKPTLMYDRDNWRDLFENVALDVAGELAWQPPAEPDRAREADAPQEDAGDHDDSSSSSSDAASSQLECDEWENAAAASEAESTRTDWELISEASTNKWQVVGSATYAAAAAMPPNAALAELRQRRRNAAPTTEGRLANPLLGRPGSKRGPGPAADPARDHRALIDDLPPLGEGAIHFAQRSRRSKQSAASRQKRMTIKAAQRARSSEY